MVNYKLKLVKFIIQVWLDSGGESISFVLICHAINSQ